MISLVLVNRGKQPIAANHPVNLALSGHSLSVEISSSKTFHILTDISCLGITLSTIHSAGDRASRAPEASIVQLPTSPLHQLLLLLLLLLQATTPVGEIRRKSNISKSCSRSHSLVSPFLAAVPAARPPTTATGEIHYLASRCCYAREEQAEPELGLNK